MLGDRYLSNDDGVADLTLYTTLTSPNNPPLQTKKRSIHTCEIIMTIIIQYKCNVHALTFYIQVY